MTKVSIETINNKQVTMIRKPFDAEWVKEQLSMGVPVLVETKEGNGDVLMAIHKQEGWYVSDLYTALTPRELSCTKTILPPLPRHPKPEDARLLHLYAANGLTVCGKSVDNSAVEHEFCFVGSGCKGVYTELDPPHDCKNHIDWFENYPITHAILEGERVEVAIEEGE